MKKNEMKKVDRFFHWISLVPFFFLNGRADEDIIYDKIIKKGSPFMIFLVRFTILFGLALALIIAFMFIKTVAMPVLQGKPIPGLNK